MKLKRATNKIKCKLSKLPIIAIHDVPSAAYYIKSALSINSYPWELRETVVPIFIIYVLKSLGHKFPSGACSRKLFYTCLI